MTDLIPRDAAIAAVNLAIWKSPIKAQISTIDASNDTAEALRAIPAIDPAAIREAALKEAAEAVSRAAWKHNGDDSYSAGLEDGARNQNEADYEAILALIGEKK